MFRLGLLVVFYYVLHQRKHQARGSQALAGCGYDVEHAYRVPARRQERLV